MNIACNVPFFIGLWCKTVHDEVTCVCVLEKSQILLLQKNEPNDHMLVDSSLHLLQIHSSVMVLVVPVMQQCPLLFFAVEKVVLR
jgi:hypothetical protein